MSKKTKMVIFKSERKKLNDIVKFNGKTIYPTVTVKYLGVKIDQYPSISYGTRPHVLLHLRD